MYYLYKINNNKNYYKNLNKKKIILKSKTVLIIYSYLI